MSVRMDKQGIEGGWSRYEFESSPALVFYETTQACDLACLHCRACAQPQRHPGELTPQQSRQLIDQIARFPKQPVLVLTGGDPFKREDLPELVAHATQAGLQVCLTPSATPLVTAEALKRLQHAGLQRLALSIDGATAATHDSFRGVHGSFERTWEIAAAAHELGLPLQINTTVGLHNVTELADIAHRLDREPVVMWSVFFLVPVGRGTSIVRLAPEMYEDVFRFLWMHSQRANYRIKTTEAPHYRRFVLEQVRQSKRDGLKPVNGHGLSRYAHLGINDGKGVLFVSHTGEIFPSGFMPLRVGSFPASNIVEVYQDSPILRQLRRPESLEGKCAACEYRLVCGGSRARAYAVTGNPYAQEPDCVYQPHDWPRSSRNAPLAAEHAH